MTEPTNGLLANANARLAALESRGAERERENGALRDELRAANARVEEAEREVERLRGALREQRTRWELVEPAAAAWGLSSEAEWSIRSIDAALAPTTISDAGGGSGHSGVHSPCPTAPAEEVPVDGPQPHCECCRSLATVSNEAAALREQLAQERALANTTLDRIRERDEAREQLADERQEVALKQACIEGMRQEAREAREQLAAAQAELTKVQGEREDLHDALCDVKRALRAAGVSPDASGVEALAKELRDACATVVKMSREHFAAEAARQPAPLPEEQGWELTLDDDDCEVWRGPDGARVFAVFLHGVECLNVEVNVDDVTDDVCVPKSIAQHILRDPALLSLPAPSAPTRDEHVVPGDEMPYATERDMDGAIAVTLPRGHHIYQAEACPWRGGIAVNIDGDKHNRIVLPWKALCEVAGLAAPPNRTEGPDVARALGILERLDGAIGEVRLKMRADSRYNVDPALFQAQVEIGRAHDALFNGQSPRTGARRRGRWSVTKTEQQNIALAIADESYRYSGLDQYSMGVIDGFRKAAELVTAMPAGEPTPTEAPAPVAQAAPAKTGDFTVEPTRSAEFALKAAGMWPREPTEQAAPATTVVASGPGWKQVRDHRMAEHSEWLRQQAAPREESTPIATLYDGAYEVHDTGHGMAISCMPVDERACWTLNEAREAIEEHAAKVRGATPPLASLEALADRWEKCIHKRDCGHDACAREIREALAATASLPDGWSVRHFEEGVQYGLTGAKPFPFVFLGVDNSVYVSNASAADVAACIAHHLAHASKGGA
jgi:hypothetical protein